jgi:tRNA 5-methylaminomethyl-2-thiouridine biosynthesis bifunctional protein
MGSAHVSAVWAQTSSKPEQWVDVLLGHRAPPRYHCGMANDPLPDPEIDWSGPAPVSARFGDVYFSAEGGLDETRHVFLAGCGLPDGWAGRARFTIGETGFGTGLNFLAAWDLWRATRTPGARLDYVAVEGYPLTREDLARALSPFKTLTPLAARLTDAWPARVPGMHRLVLGDGVTLTIIFDEALPALRGLMARVDAWFLDGFAPAKNPAIWRAPVMTEIARLSAPGARLASFTVARPVREALAQAGFASERVPGFGRKRQCLTARLETPPTTPGAAPHAAPWYARPAAPGVKRIAVIGAGIAGASVARALAARGIEVSVFDRDGPASGASAIAPALVMPRLARGGGAPALFHRAAWLHAIRLLNDLPTERTGWRPHGVVQLATTKAEEARFARQAADGLMPPDMLHHLSASEASAVAGVALDCPALHFPHAGTVDGPGMVAALLDGIPFTRAAVTPRHAGDGWALMAGDAEIWRGDAVVLAHGCAVSETAGAEAIELVPTSGQIIRLPMNGQSAQLKTALVFGHYLSPPIGGHHLLGGTHDKNAAAAITGAASARLLKAARKALPDLFDGADPAALPAWAGLRAGTADRMPVTGPLPDRRALLEAYARLAHGPRAMGRHGQWPEAPFHTGLYALTGLGSRGFATAPLLAEMLAEEITGAPLPVPRGVAEALHPARFIVRRLIKRKTA